MTSYTFLRFFGFVLAVKELQGKLEELKEIRAPEMEGLEEEEEPEQTGYEEETEEEDEGEDENYSIYQSETETETETEDEDRDKTNTFEPVFWLGVCVCAGVIVCAHF